MWARDHSLQQTDFKQHNDWRAELGSLGRGWGGCQAPHAAQSPWTRCMAQMGGWAITRSHTGWLCHCTQGMPGWGPGRAWWPRAQSHGTPSEGCCHLQGCRASYTELGWWQGAHPHSSPPAPPGHSTTWDSALTEKFSWMIPDLLTVRQQSAGNQEAGRGWRVALSPCTCTHTHTHTCVNWEATSCSFLSCQATRWLRMHQLWTEGVMGRERGGKETGGQSEATTKSSWHACTARYSSGLWPEWTLINLCRLLRKSPGFYQGRKRGIEERGPNAHKQRAGTSKSKNFSMSKGTNTKECGRTEVKRNSVRDETSSTASQHDAETKQKVSLEAHSFPTGPGQNVGLQTSKEEQSFLGLRQEDHINSCFSGWPQPKAMVTVWSHVLCVVINVPHLQP